MVECYDTVSVYTAENIDRIREFVANQESNNHDWKYFIDLFVTRMDYMFIVVDLLSGWA